MESERLSTPHIPAPDDLAFFKQLDEVRASRIGAYLLDFADYEGIRVERGQLPPTAAYARQRERGKLGIAINEGTNAIMIVHGLEMIRHDAVFPEILSPDIKQAPLAYTFESVARDAIANTVAALHVIEPQKNIPVEIFFKDSNFPTDMAERIRKMMETQFSEGGKVRTEARLNSCSVLFKANLEANARDDAKNVLKLLRATAAVKEQLGRSVELSSLLTVALSAEALIFGVPLAIPIFLALNTAWGMRSWNAAGNLTEDADESLKSAFGRVHKLAELPFGWGNFLDKPPVEGYGTQGFVESLMGKQRMASIASISRHSERNLAMRGLHRVQAHFWPGK